MSVSVYTVANDRFFPGLVGLVSSLRVQGHDGPIVVVDTGLTRGQVRNLSGDTTIVRPPTDLPALYAKPFGPLEQPDDTMLLIDADMLCVRPLGDIVDRVRAGSIVAVEDIGRPGLSDATWRQWERRLDLGPLKQGPYVNGGLFALPREQGIAFFTTFAECLERVDPTETHMSASTHDFGLPFFLLDQDVGNAILGSAPFHDRTFVLPYRYAPHPPFRGVRVTPELSCVDDAGVHPYFLHHALQKPWLEPLPSNPYTELLIKYVHHPAAPSVDDDELPPFLRAGRLAPATRALRSARGHVRGRVRGKLGLRPYLEKRMQRLLRP
jgi:hypothetical protein